MDANSKRFHDRLRRIEGAHGAGAQTVIRPDGLVVLRRRTRLRLGGPWRSLGLVVICLVLFKAFMIWNQGEVGYAARLADLESRSSGHRAVAWVLALDPVSLFLARSLTESVGPPPE